MIHLPWIKLVVGCPADGPAALTRSRPDRPGPALCHGGQNENGEFAEPNLSDSPNPEPTPNSPNWFMVREHAYSCFITNGNKGTYRAWGKCHGGQHGGPGRLELGPIRSQRQHSCQTPTSRDASSPTSRDASFHEHSHPVTPLHALKGRPNSKQNCKIANVMFSRMIMPASQWHVTNARGPE